MFRFESCCTQLLVVMMIFIYRQHLLNTSITIYIQWQYIFVLIKHYYIIRWIYVEKSHNTYRFEFEYQTGRYIDSHYYAF